MSSVSNDDSAPSYFHRLQILSILQSIHMILYSYFTYGLEFFQPLGEEYHHLELQQLSVYEANKQFSRQYPGHF